MNFVESLQTAWRQADSMLCVGLDPDPSRLPAHLADRPDAILAFCREVVDATAGFACAFKPQVAYFAAARAEDQLEALIAHIHRAHPGIPVILDAKRGDIGATAEQYAREAFERYRADAVTVNPYMGFDSIEPWLGVARSRRDPAVPDVEPRRRRPAVARRRRRTALRARRTTGRRAVEHQRPARPGRRRDLSGGTGAACARSRRTCLCWCRESARRAATSTPRCGGRRDAGMIVNSSRAILYASGGEDFAQAAAGVARATRDALREAVARH